MSERTAIIIFSDDTFEYASEKVAAAFEKMRKEVTRLNDELTCASEAFHAIKAENTDPIVAIKSMMEEKGLTNVDLYDVFGGKSRTSEILRRKRPLQVSHIRKLNEIFGLPLFVLCAEYYLARTPAPQPRALETHLAALAAEGSAE